MTAKAMKLIISSISQNFKKMKSTDQRKNVIIGKL